MSRVDSQCGRAVGDRQFMSINGRPCDLAKATRVANDVYRQFNTTQSPAVVLDVRLSRGRCAWARRVVSCVLTCGGAELVDVNVTPDKRTLFVQREAQLLEFLRVCRCLWHPCDCVS